MITSIISIGNSRGIRIPKLALIESGLGQNVELKVKTNEIRIVPAPKKQTNINSLSLASEKTFAKDWLRKEEDEAWKVYQQDL